MRKLGMGFFAFFKLLKEAAQEWIADDASRLSAALAYYATFSMAPLLVICISLASLIFGEQAARGQILEEISALAGPEVGRAIQSFILDAWQESHGGWAALIGFGVLLFGATRVFSALKDALNTIWGVVARPGQPVVTLLRDRLLSFSMVLVIGFLLLTSLLVSASVAAVTRYFAQWVPMHPSLLEWSDLALSLVVVSLLFALMLKLLPDVHIGWGDVWLGAVLTSGLFAMGKSALALYLGTSGVTSSFGAAGSIVAFLLWVYYSAGILFFGAEFTKCYTRQFGSGVTPNSRAMMLTDYLLETARKPRPETEAKWPLNESGQLPPTASARLPYERASRPGGSAGSRLE